MKRIYSNSRVFMFLVSALMLVGCYKDKGNYAITMHHRGLQVYFHIYGATPHAANTP